MSVRLIGLVLGGKCYPPIDYCYPSVLRNVILASMQGSFSWPIDVPWPRLHRTVILLGPRVSGVI